MKELKQFLDDVKAKLQTANDNDKEFYQVELITLNAIVDFALRYKQFAFDNGYEYIFGCT